MSRPWRSALASLKTNPAVGPASNSTSDADESRSNAQSVVREPTSKPPETRRATDVARPGKDHNVSSRPSAVPR